METTKLLAWKMMTRWATVGMIGAGMLMGVAEPGIGQMRLAQVEASSEVEAIEPFTIEGTLDENSEVLQDDGTYYNVHTFEGQAGQIVEIQLMSDEFDTYLLLRSPDGSLLSQNDDGSEGTNSRIVVSLPIAGTYTILTNTYTVGETGRYTLSLQPASNQDVAAAEQLAEAEQLNQQASELHQQGRYADAIPLAQRALDIRETALGDTHPDVATSLNNLALLYKAQGNYAQAEPLYVRSLQIRETALGEDHPDVATSLNNLALLYQAQGNYVQAEPLYARSLQIRETALGEDHPDVATSLNNLAELYRAQGNYGRAEPLYARSLQIWETALGEDHPDVAQSLNNLALLYQAQGNYAQAEPLYVRSLQILETALGEDHPNVAASLNNLAELYRAQGNYAQAEPLYARSLQIWETALGADHPDVATSLNNLALLYQAQGNYAQAEPLYARSLQILETALGEDHPNVAASLNNLAGLYQAQGNYAQAEPLYERSLQIRETALGDNHPAVATSLNNLAGLYQAQGNYAQAEPLYERSLQIRETALGDDHPDVAQSLNNLAGLYKAQGNYAQAEPLYARSLQIRETALGPDHSDVANSLNNLALLYQAQGNTVQAVQFLQQGLAIEERNLELNLATLTEAQRQDYAATLSGSTDGAVSLALQNPEAEFLGLTTLLRRKGRLLEAGSSIWQRLRQNLTPADQTVLDEFIAIQQQLATLTFNPPATLSPDQYRQQLTQLETQQADLEKTLAQRSATFRVETQPVDIATVQSQIPANGVLVEYVRYRPFDAKASQSERFGNPRYAAYLLFTDGRIEVVDLGDAAEIDVAVQSFVGLLQNRSANLQRTGAVPTTRTELVEQVTGDIKALVFDPIAPYLQDTDHLLISPDGQLNVLPFEALQAEAGGDYLIQQYQISYLNSGRDLLKFDLLEPSPNPAVILANPDYATADASLPTVDADFVANSDRPLPKSLSQDGRGTLLRLPFARPGRRGWGMRVMNPTLDPLPKSLSQDGRGTSIQESRGTSIQLPFARPGRRGWGMRANQPAPPRLAIGTESGAPDNRRSTDLSQIQVGPLPGTAAEAEAIRPLLPNANILTEAAATENQLKTLQSPRILHIATHGFFLENVDRPTPNDQRGIRIEAFDNPLASPITPGIAVENPLLRSGLALAGFNTRTSGSEDGVLTALEASQLNLSGTQLVVLSACDTGLGDISNGEGVYGLRRAFAIAGAESQLMSLWQVSDFGTQSLMAQYYEKLTAGLGRSEALREVQLEMIEEGGQYSHPYYWAAFILAGEWRSLD